MSVPASGARGGSLRAAHGMRVAAGLAVAVVAAGICGPSGHARASEGGTVAAEASAASAPGRARIAADIPVQRDREPSTEGTSATLRTGISLAMLALAAAVALGFRRRRRSPAPDGVPTGLRFPWFTRLSSDAVLSVPHTVRLTTHASVHVVKWRGREWLIACAGDGVTVLGTGGDGCVPAPARAEGGAVPDGAAAGTSLAVERRS